MATASDFLNSLGVNTHAAFGTGAYQNTSLTAQALNYLGVSSVRDGFREHGVGAQTLNALAEAGIKISFIVSSSTPEGGDPALANFITGLERFLDEHPGSILGVEGLNEANIYEFSYQGSSSMEAAALFQQALYTAVNGSATLGDIPVLNMTIGYDDVEAYAALGDLSQYSDFANVHTYTHTRYAADATQQYQISLALGVNNNDPLIITETGYTTLEEFNYLGVSETAQAKLILNGLLDAFENGSQMTYLYELFDTNTGDTGDSESHFGLFHTDGSAKAAAIALHNLTTILAYGDEGIDSSREDLAYELSNMPANSHSLVLSKANGVNDIVLWAEPEIWDDINNVDAVTVTTTVTVNLGRLYGTIYVYDPLIGTDPIAVYTNVNSITIQVGDHPIIVEIGATSPVTEVTENVAAELTLTASELVAQIDHLANTDGLETVNLNGDHILKVSSSATMNYMITNYQDVLSKIVDGYSFTVEVAQSTWRMVTAYDFSGKVTSVTEWGLHNGTVLSEKISYPDGSSYTESYRNGLLVSSATVNSDGDTSYATYKSGVKSGEIINHANGSYETYDYGITGQKYTQQHQIFNTSGKIQILERFGDDNFSQVYRYDTTTGKIVSFVQHATNGTDSYFTYRSDGSQKATYIHYADGASESYDYGITGKNFASQHQIFDKGGKIAVLERWLKDGTLSYVEKHQATQTVYSIYNTAGVLTETKTVLDAGGGITVLHAVNGSGDYTSYTYSPSGLLTRKIAHDADYADTATSYIGGVKTSVYIKYMSGKAESFDYGIIGKSYTSQHQVFDSSNKLLLLERFGEGGYSQITRYDAASGKITSLDQTNANGSESHYIYTSAGVLKSTYLLNVDGSSERYQYGISDKGYTLERMHADGTRDYLEKHLSDRTVYYEYNEAGFLTEMTSIKLDGSKTIYHYAEDRSGDYTYESFSGSTGTLTTRIVHDEGVSDVTTRYVNGQISTVATSFVDGSRESLTYKPSGSGIYLHSQQSFDTSGKLVALERFNPDGLTVYTEIHSGGTTTFGIYTADGVKTEMTFIAADGSRDSYYYSTTTAGMVTHKSIDTSGNTVFVDVGQVDGTHAVTGYGGDLVLTGNIHDDVFIFRTGATGRVDFSGGHDSVFGFSSTANRLDLNDSAGGDVSSVNIYQSGADTIIFIDEDNSITLKNMAYASLSGDWLIL